MERNIGGLERILRVASGSTLVLLGVRGYLGVLRLAYIAPQAITSVSLTLLGMASLISGLIGKCPLYSILGKESSD